MRIMLIARMPHQSFNAALKDGTASAKLGRILETLKPEAAYFTELDGRRTGILIVDLPDASKIPAVAEPWFLTFGADVEIHPVMTADDLKKSGIDEIAKKWT
jgi:hypothetical protein